MGIPLLNVIFFIILLILAGLVFGTLDTPPQLECLENAMRLHFVPDPSDAQQPFGGHVYLKGFFFTTHCHMDYTMQPIAQPFYFHIPYRSECQVKRERSMEGEQGRNGSGVSYSTIVIVQHHRLFVTNRDKAYAINCFYRETKPDLEKKMEIGDLTPTEVSGTKEAPVCVYEVLRDGEPVRYANVGDVLVHRWTCDTVEMGMLVHSCVIRDGLGHSFALLDSRGCVIDPSLLAPLTYTMQLNSSSTPISAFKFADQMVAYFSCQITLCDKRENGCEGITPPICEMIPLPSNGGPSMPVVPPPPQGARDIPPAVRSLFLPQYPPHQNPPSGKCCGGWGTAQGRVRDLQRRDGARVQIFGRDRWPQKVLRQRRSQRTMERTARMELHFENGTTTTTRSPPVLANGIKSKSNPKLITVDVMADRLLVFTTDEGPTVAERQRLISPPVEEADEQHGGQLQKTPPQQSSECTAQTSAYLYSVCTAAVLLPLSLLALFLQRHILRRNTADRTFTPSDSTLQYEMAGIPATFLSARMGAGSTNKYGRF